MTGTCGYCRLQVGTRGDLLARHLYTGRTCPGSGRQPTERSRETLDLWVDTLRAYIESGKWADRMLGIAQDRLEEHVEILPPAFLADRAFCETSEGVRYAELRAVRDALRLRVVKGRVAARELPRALADQEAWKP